MCGLAFATLVLGVVALIRIDQSHSNSILSVLMWPDRALVGVLMVVAALLALEGLKPFWHVVWSARERRTGTMIASKVAR